MDDHGQPAMPAHTPGSREGHWYIAWWFLALTIYLLSTGPVAWAVNNEHLPDVVQVVYLPLLPLMKIGWVNDLFFLYTVRLWGGFPYGYTTI